MYPDGMHDVHIISVGIMFYLLSKLQWYGTFLPQFHFYKINNL